MVILNQNAPKKSKHKNYEPTTSFQISTKHHPVSNKYLKLLCKLVFLI
jgi:hypothetical protein